MGTKVLERAVGVLPSVPPEKLCSGRNKELPTSLVHRQSSQLSTSFLPPADFRY